MNDDRHVEAFVLAGGISSRMGCEKGLLPLGGVPLIVRTVRLAEEVVGRSVVVGSPERYQPLGLAAISDRDFGIASEAGRSGGPLLGVATALAESQATHSLILACDLPYLTSEWLRWLVARSMQSGSQAVVPESADGLQPLAAVYRNDCSSVVRQSLSGGNRSVQRVLQEMDVERILEIEWRDADPNRNVLKNMNTPADYDEACRWWESRSVR